MIPKKYDIHEYDYPDFQPDQVLGSDHLNHSFAFNEQQIRLSRTNLIGIGIVCGLKASKSNDGKTITISKGTGITSHGYLIVHGKENSEEPIEYKKYRSFNLDIVRDLKYDALVSGITTKYDIWELLDANEAKATDPELTNAFLNTKVCLLFYEMLEEDAKNCDTTSCDDKGKTVTTTLRKLLVNVADADKIISESNARANAVGSGELFPGISSLPEIKLPRFDVLSTSPVTTSDLYAAYQKVFTKSLVESIGNTLNKAYNLFKNYLKENSNPFAQFNTVFAFLHNSTISNNDLLHFQYYWDFFADLISAYNEWRLAAQPLGAMCTPPEALFPRHLFLCYFGETVTVEKSKYRNDLIPSPLLNFKESDYQEFNSLFQRLARMISNRNFPLPVVGGSKTADSNIRITPSLLGNHSLGNRAIPYYYKANESSNRLLDVWNHAETKRGRQNKILGYNTSYNLTDDFVKNPLRYDLEPYNFFRIEGHIGKRYDDVLSTLKKAIATYRLPIDVIALELSTDASNTKIDDVCGLTNIQMQYELLRNEVRCCLRKDIAYWGQLVIKDPPKAGGQGTGSGGGSVLGTEWILVENLTFTTPSEKEMVKNENIKYMKLADSLKQAESYFSVQDPGLTGEIKRLATKISAASSTIKEEPPKASIIKNTILEISQESIAGKYYDIQKKGNISIGSISAPEPVFNAALLTHYALVIIDEMEELLLLLQAENVLLLNLDNFSKHTESLKKAYETLGPLLSNYLKTQESVHTIKATVGEASHAKVDSIAAAMPEILKKNQSLIILLLLNENNTTINTLISDLQKATTNEAKQKAIDDASTKLDKDGMMVPAKKDIAYTEDPILKEISDKLKNPGCLCGHENFKSLQELLKKEIEALKKLNLFSNFAKKHPGIQHKAGVPMSGTFILVYHRKGTPSVPQYDSAIKALQDSLVVADFYLPYLCCSDCQPINFTVNIPPPVLAFDLGKTEFCNNDTEAYPFITNPTGGKLTSTQKDSVKNNGDETYSFLPEKVSVPANSKDITVNFTYTLNDQMKSIGVKVYVHPVVKIIAKADADNPLKIDFTFDKPGLVASCNWNFGDGNSATVISPSHIYLKSGSYTVACEVINGPCSFSPEKFPLTVKEPDPVKIDLNQTEICKGAKAITFTVTPKGGGFSGEGFTESPAGSGKFKFTPSDVSSDGTPLKKVDFHYSSPAGITGSKQITVFEKPQADTTFRFMPGSTTDAKFVFTNLKFASQLEIDYGDGSEKETFDVTSGQSSYTTTTHIFPGPGPFKVSAKIINGPCSMDLTPLDIQFKVEEEFKKTCQSLTVPLNDYIKLRNALHQSSTFQELYSPQRLKEVDTFFEGLQKQIKQDANVPVSYFAQNVLDPEWIANLPVNHEQTRSLSIRLMTIFYDLVTTISCLKNEDIDLGKISTIRYMDAVATKIEELKQLSTTDKELLRPLIDDIEDERKRLDKNKEAEKKKLFFETLLKMKELIKKLS